MSPRRAHVVLSLSYVATRLLLYGLGLRFSFALDWMWLADAGDLRERLLETLYYYHAFPPGMNAITGALLKLSEGNAAGLAQGLFWLLGLLFANAIVYLGRAVGLSSTLAFALAFVFTLAPATLYFEHLYLYEWPIATMLCLSAVLFHRAIRAPSFAMWLAFFSVTAAVALTRSTFHLLWFVAILMLSLWFATHAMRRIVLASALVPALCLVSLYTKNLLLFGDFAASTFGPASYTLVTVARLPGDVRDAWIREGRLSPFAGVSVYAPPRDYSRFFATAGHDGWPPQLTRLEHATVASANFNHWWLLEVHRARRADVIAYLRDRPLAYAENVLDGLRMLFSATTTWHPRDGTVASPHHQHREVLGAYERWYNRVIHGAPIGPVGLYLFVPMILFWAGIVAIRLASSTDASLRARGALLLFCVFQIAYVVAVSSMFTALESSRYRFQIEWAIWLTAAAGVDALRRRVLSPSRHVSHQSSVISSQRRTLRAVPFPTSEVSRPFPA